MSLKNKLCALVSKNSGEDLLEKCCNKYGYEKDKLDTMLKKVGVSLLNEKYKVLDDKGCIALYKEYTCYDEKKIVYITKDEVQIFVDKISITYGITKEKIVPKHFIISGSYGTIEIYFFENEIRQYFILRGKVFVVVLTGKNIIYSIMVAKYIESIDKMAKKIILNFLAEDIYDEKYVFRIQTYFLMDMFINPDDIDVRVNILEGEYSFYEITFKE